MLYNLVVMGGESRRIICFITQGLVFTLNINICQNSWLLYHPKEYLVIKFPVSGNAAWIEPSLVSTTVSIAGALLDKHFVDRGYQKVDYHIEEALKEFEDAIEHYGESSKEVVSEQSH